MNGLVTLFKKYIILSHHDNSKFIASKIIKDFSKTKSKGHKLSLEQRLDLWKNGEFEDHSKTHKKRSKIISTC